MAIEKRGASLPGIVAAADFSAAGQHRFVTINGAGKAALTGDGLKADAVLDNNPIADQACQLYGPGSVMKVEASAAIALGANVSSAASGKAKTSPFSCTSVPVSIPIGNVRAISGSAKMRSRGDRKPITTAISIRIKPSRLKDA